MIAVEVLGQDAFLAALDAAIASIPQQVSFAYAAWTRTIFKDLVEGTPQWSGDTASNWNYSVNQPDGSYSELPDKALMWPLPKEFREGLEDPYHRGSWRAVSIAMDRMNLVMPPAYDQKVFFSNNTPIAPALEDHSTYVRPVNLIGDAVAMASYIAAKYSNLPV